jgi:hypothetical protein
MSDTAYAMLGVQDDIAEGHIGLANELILWWPIVCTPQVGPKKVGPVTVQVDQVCVP